MFEISISKRPAQDTYLIVVYKNLSTRELWRSFTIQDQSTAFIVFSHLESFIKKLREEYFVTEKMENEADLPNGEK